MQTCFLPPQVLIAGGGGLPCSGAMTPASRSSYLINVTHGADHSITEELMRYRRVVSHRISEPLHGWLAG